jgi:DNA polymerase-1
VPTEPGKDYVGTNYKLQTTAAEILKRGLVDLDSAGYGPYMTLPVHDEINLDIPREEAKDAEHDVGKILEATTTGEFRVPLTWSAELLPGAWGGRELEFKNE